MEYSKPVQAEQYSVETSQLVTGHTLSTESYSTALVSLTTCVASPITHSPVPPELTTTVYWSGLMEKRRSHTLILTNNDN